MSASRSPVNGSRMRMSLSTATGRPSVRAISISELATGPGAAAGAAVSGALPHAASSAVSIAQRTRRISGFSHDCVRMLGMNRREFLGTLAAAPLAVGAQTLTGKRTFDVTTRIELPGARGRTVAWIPLPLSRTTPVPYQETSIGIGQGAAANTTTLKGAVDVGGASVSMAEWKSPGGTPFFNVTYRVTTTNHRVRLDDSRPQPQSRPHPVHLD